MTRRALFTRLLSALAAVPLVGKAIQAKSAMVPVADGLKYFAAGTPGVLSVMDRAIICRTFQAFSSQSFVSSRIVSTWNPPHSGS